MHNYNKSIVCEVRNMKSGSSITVWFGKEIDINTVHTEVKRLKAQGYVVAAPFYIGYNINDSLVRNYLKNSLDNSDYLYLLGSTGSLLEEIVEYANKTNKEIIRKESLVVCCL